MNDASAVVEGEIESAQLLRAVFAKRWTILGCTLAAFGAALIFVSLVAARYSADARLLLEIQDSFLPRAEKGEAKSDVAPLDPEAVQSQIELIKSRDLARRVIKTLALSGNEEFDPLARGVGLLTRALAALGLARDPIGASPEDRILESFSEKLNVISPTKTRVLAIEFTSRNPDLAAKGANAVADAYIEVQREAKRENARAAAKNLASLVAELRARVAEAEGAAEAFRVKSGLLVGANNTTINAQHLSDLNTQLSLFRGAQADAQAKANLIREMLQSRRLADIPDVANNEVMRRLTEQRVALRAQLALESRTLLPGHPRIKELQAQLDDLDRQMRAAAERIVRTLENEARIAGARVDNLARALDEQKKVVAATEGDDVRLRELERTARLYKEQLEAATAKYQEALSRESAEANPADARIVQKALAPQTPSFPKKIPILAFASIAGFVLSLGAIVVGELLKAPPRGPAAGRPARAAEEPAADETVTPFKRPFSEPPGKGRPAAPAAGASLSATRASRAAASAPPAEPAPVKVLMASAVPDRQAFASALMLARSLAEHGRTILVSADAGASAWKPGEDVETPKGLNELATGAASLDDVISKEEKSRLHLIGPGREDGAKRGDLSPVVEALARTYDFIVFTTSTAIDALSLAPMFDKVLLRASQAENDELLTALSQSCDDVCLIEDSAGAAIPA
jgi:uncharacterized protein involved in exopolysaccharide biosynthesis